MTGGISLDNGISAERLNEYDVLISIIRRLLVISLIELAFCFLLKCPIYSEPARRIVSLSPSLTEILFGLGISDRIIGVTTYCNYPEMAKKKPKVGGIRNPSLEAIVSLRPDLVVMSSEITPPETKERLNKLGIRVYVFRSRSLADFSGGLRELGDVIGVRSEAYSMARNIDADLARLKRKKMGKRVAVILWPEPIIIAGPGTIIDEAITLLGYTNVASGARTRYPMYSMEQLILLAPDAVFIDRGHIRQDEVFKDLKSRLKKISSLSGNCYFPINDSLDRLGPRLIEGIEIMNRCLSQSH